MPALPCTCMPWLDMDQHCRPPQSENLDLLRRIATPQVGQQLSLLTHQTCMLQQRQTPDQGLTSRKHVHTPGTNTGLLCKNPAKPHARPYTRHATGLLCSNRATSEGRSRRSPQSPHPPQRLCCLSTPPQTSPADCRPSGTACSARSARAECIRRGCNRCTCHE